ncbi:MAG: AzlD domain-containing protein, partial [Clostridia bacterium]|nr:AzlD domain-containing protein [Clostridia bacterium]
MTITEQIVTIGLCVLATVLTRFLPFIIFRGNKPAPKYVQYLGRALPASIFSMLVVYCLKNVNVTAYSFGIPELIAIIAV